MSTDRTAESDADEYRIIWTPDRMESYYFERVTPASTTEGSR